MRSRSVLSVESASDFPTARGSVQEEVLAVYAELAADQLLSVTGYV